MLDSLQRHPRIAGIHSVSAAGEVLDCLAAQPIQCAILHLWLGNTLQTARALELRCYFSVNSHMLQRKGLLEQLPLDGVLTETDHPFGDRANGRAHRPERVDDVERQLATMHRVKQVDIAAEFGQTSQISSVQRNAVRFFPTWFAGVGDGVVPAGDI